MGEPPRGGQGQHPLLSNSSYYQKPPFQTQRAPNLREKLQDTTLLESRGGATFKFTSCRQKNPNAQTSQRHHQKKLYTTPFMNLKYTNPKQQIYLSIIYFWLCWLSVATRGLVSRWARGFSLRRPLSSRPAGSKRVGFSSCGPWA